MQRKADAVVRHAILRKVVGADLFAAVAGLDLATAFRGKRGLLLFLFQFI